MTAPDYADLRRRAAVYEDEWLWHEQTDEELAGHGRWPTSGRGGTP